MAQKRKSLSKHEFAIYHPIDFVVSMPDVGSELHIENSSLVHRIQRVLRLHVGGHFVLFDRYAHADVTILGYSKKALQVKVEAIVENAIYAPEITFLLPLLKKDALEHAIYYLVEVGVNKIQLLHTAKEHGRWRGSNDWNRFERIVIAAAEQSKHYAFPEIIEPIPFGQIETILPKNALRFYGDPAGKSAHTLLNKKAPHHIVLTCGPEGGFTQEEQEQISGASFQSLRLTPTILRAEIAALCLSSLFRTVFS